MNSKWLWLMMLAGPGWMGATIYYLCELVLRTPHHDTFDALFSWAVWLLICVAQLLWPGIATWLVIRKIQHEFRMRELELTQLKNPEALGYQEENELSSWQYNRREEQKRQAERMRKNELKRRERLRVMQEKGARSLEAQLAREREKEQRRR
jgi:hypothetical protein